jgi:hypothetical protein
MNKISNNDKKKILKYLKKNLKDNPLVLDYFENDDMMK